MTEPKVCSVDRRPEAAGNARLRTTRRINSRVGASRTNICRAGLARLALPPAGPPLGVGTTFVSAWRALGWSKRRQRLGRPALRPAIARVVDRLLKQRKRAAVDAEMRSRISEQNVACREFRGAELYANPRIGKSVSLRGLPSTCITCGRKTVAPAWRQQPHRGAIHRFLEAWIAQMNDADASSGGSSGRRPAG